jgi:MFS transporter, FHS family, L-fucose permease
MPELTSNHSANNTACSMLHLHSSAIPVLKWLLRAHVSTILEAFDWKEVQVLDCILSSANNKSAVINYVVETREGTSSADAARFLAGAQGGFALGRFVGSFMMKYVRPRWVFLIFMAGCIVFIAPSITQRGNTGMSMLYITLFFESIIFPTIVALGMRGLGKYSKRGSGLIVGGVAGGAVVPPLLFAAADTQGAVNYETGNAPTALAMTVPLAFFVAASTYTVAVNFIPAYRDVADKFSTTKIGVEGAAATTDEEGVVGEESKSDLPVQTEAVGHSTNVEKASG